MKKVFKSILASLLLLVSISTSNAASGGYSNNPAGGYSAGEWLQCATTKLCAKSPSVTSVCNAAGTSCGTFAGLVNMVTSGLVMANNAVVRGDGGARGVQDSGVILDDSDNITGVNDFTADGLLKAGSAPTTLTDAVGKILAAALNTVGIGQGGTGATTKAGGFDALSPLSALGDLLFGGAAGTGDRLAGNITTTKKFLTQTGDGTDSAAPSWGQVVDADIPNDITINHAGTATALAANGSNCSSGSLAGGVDASGASEDCTDVWTEAENTSAGYVATETDPVVGAITGIVKANGAGAISAASAGTDYQAPLGYTAEDAANKSTNVVTDGASDTKYPSVKAAKDYADGLVAGLLDYRGAYDASVNTFPAAGGSGTAGAVMKGDMWIISVAGTLGSVAVQVGDSVIANVDTPAQTASNWNILNSNISFAPEDSANKVTSLSSGSTDTQYPSAKLVYDQLAGKQASGSYALSGANSDITSLTAITTILQTELAADPLDPDEGKFVCWATDGTGTGDDGDQLCKRTAGGVTKMFTLFDYSTGKLGDANTATTLAANGSNCSTGSAALGVDASGASEGCFDVWTEAENTSAGYLTSLSGAVLTSQATPQTIGATGSRLAKLWATDVATTDLTVTNAISGSVTGNAGTCTTASAGDSATDFFGAGTSPYVNGGTDVAVADGGTGKSSWTQWLIPYADTTTSFSQIAIGSAGEVLTSNGAGAAPTFQIPASSASEATQTSYVLGENFVQGEAGYLGVFSFITQLVNDSTNNRVGYATGDHEKWGQTFSNTYATGIKNIILSMAKYGSPTDNLVVKIYASNKTTLLGTSVVVDGSTLSTSYADITFTFTTPVAIAANTTYFFEISRSGAFSTSNFYFIQGSTSDVYASGDCFDYDTSWIYGGSNYGLYDLYFKLQEYRALKTDADVTATLKPIGYANAAGSTGDTKAFNTSGVTTIVPTGTPAVNDTMYLSNTAGQVQNSAGTNSVKVGRMISATKMLIIMPPL